MLKRLLLGGATALLTVSAQAQTFHSIIVTYKDGGESKMVDLTNSLRTTFNESEIIFTDGETPVLSVEKSAIDCFTFSEASGISTLNGDEATTLFINGRHFTVSSPLITDSCIRISDLEGRTVYSVRPESEVTEIDADAFAAGVYILSVNKMSYKIVLK